jgi:hypothetical protein
MFTGYLIHTESRVSTPLVLVSQLLIHFKMSSSLFQFPSLFHGQPYITLSLSLSSLVVSCDPGRNLETALVEVNREPCALIPLKVLRQAPQGHIDTIKVLHSLSILCGRELYSEVLEFSVVSIDEWLQQHGRRSCPLVLGFLLLDQVEELREGLVEPLLQHLSTYVV